MPPPQAGQVMPPSISRSPPTSGAAATGVDAGRRYGSCCPRSQRQRERRRIARVRPHAERPNERRQNARTARRSASVPMTASDCRLGASLQRRRRIADPRRPLALASGGRARLGSRGSNARAEAGRAFVRRSLGRSAWARTRRDPRRSRTRASAEGRPAPHQGVSPAARSLGASARPATPRSCASRVRRRPALRAARRRARAPAACR